MNGQSSTNMFGNLFRLTSGMPLLISLYDFCTSKCQTIKVIKSASPRTLNEYGFSGPCYNDSNSTKELPETKQSDIVQKKEIETISLVLLNFHMKTTPWNLTKPQI